MNTFFALKKPPTKMKLSLFILAFIIFFSATSPLFAQDMSQTSTLKLTAIPARLGDADYSLKAKPGESVQTTVRIKNSSMKVQFTKTVVEDFIIGDDGEQPVPVSQDLPSQWNLAKWITVTPANQSLKPGEIGTVNVVIQVPADAPAGGRYAMIMHYPAVSEEIQGSGSGISQRVGTLLYFVVDGEVNQEAYIRNIEVKKFFEFGPVPFSFTFENRSAIHVHPNIQVEFRNMLGQKSGEIAIGSKNIFPGGTRAFNGSWEKIWGVGKYTATITANYGTSGKVALGTFSFWMMPIRVILAMSFGIIFFVTMLLLTKSKVEDNIKEKQEEKKLLDQKISKRSFSNLEPFKDNHN